MIWGGHQPGHQPGHHPGHQPSMIDYVIIMAGHGSLIYNDEIIHLLSPRGVKEFMRGIYDHDIHLMTITVLPPGHCRQRV